MSTDDTEIGKRLLALRKRSGLSQTDYAASLGVSLRAYQTYERGQRTVPTEVLKELVWKYEVNPIWVISGRGPEKWVQGSGINTGLFAEILRRLGSEGSPIRGRNPVEFGYFAAVIYNRIKDSDQGSWDGAVQQAIVRLDAILSAQWARSVEQAPAPLKDSRWLELVETAKQRGGNVDPQTAALSWGPGSELERLFITGEI